MKEQSKKYTGNTVKTLSALVILAALCGGCATKKADEELVKTQNNVSEMEHRVAAIEGRVQALDQEVNSTQGAVYDVYSSRGKKTGMTARAVPAEQGKPVMYASPKSNTPAPSAQRYVAQAPAKRTATPKPTPAVTPTPQQLAQATQPAPNATPTAPLGSLDPNSKMSLSATSPQNQGAAPALSLPPESAMYTPTAPGMPPATAAVATSSFTPPAQPVVAQPVAAQPAVAVAPVAPMVAAAPVHTPSAPAVAGEKGAYAHALSLVRGGQATAGRAAFEAFLQAYPQSKLVPNAYYWIGESFYSQANYTNALFAFKQVTANFPRHHKTSDALLKAGLTYQKLGDNDNAQMQYRALLADFPNSSAAKIVRSRKL